MFWMTYWFVAFALLFFLPGISFLMLLLYVCIAFLKPLINPMEQKVQTAQTPVNAVDTDEPQPVVSPDHGRQHAIDMDEQARVLDEESLKDEVLQQNAVDHESESSLQDRLEAEYR